MCYYDEEYDISEEKKARDISEAFNTMYGLIVNCSYVYSDLEQRMLDKELPYLSEEEVLSIVVVKFYDEINKTNNRLKCNICQLELLKVLERFFEKTRNVMLFVKETMKA